MNHAKIISTIIVMIMCLYSCLLNVNDVQGSNTDLSPGQPSENIFDGIVYEFRSIEDYGASVTNNRDFDLIYGAVDGFSSGFFADEYKPVFTECLEKYSKSPEYQGNDRLPVIYNLIRDIGISKEEFVRSNETMKALKLSDMSLGIYVYTDQEIEYLFGNYDRETVIRHLKAPTAFYYEGRLYTVYDLEKLDDSILKAMSENGGLNAYLDFMAEFNSACREYCESKYADSYYLPQYVSGYNQVDEVINGLIARFK